MVAVDLRGDAWTGDYTAELKVSLFPNSFCTLNQDTLSAPHKQNMTNAVGSFYQKSPQCFFILPGCSKSSLLLVLWHFYLYLQRLECHWSFFTDTYWYPAIWYEHSAKILKQWYYGSVFYIIAYALVSTSSPIFAAWCGWQKFPISKWLGKCSDNATRAFYFFFF